MAKCKAGIIIGTAGEPGSSTFVAALADQFSWPARRLSKQMRLTKYPIGATTIKDHRRKVCGCYNDD